MALILDGKRFASDELVIAVGVTLRGDKVILGLVQTATENEKACSDFLRELVDRGLKDKEGLLVVIDGSKGLRKIKGHKHLPRLREVLKKNIMEQELQKLGRAA